jgi:hypothetical protein
MTDWSVNEISDHRFEVFHWFKDDYEYLDILIFFEEWEWWKFNDKSFHFILEIKIRVFIILIFRIEFFVFSNVLINSLIDLFRKAISEFSFRFFAFVFWMFCWSTFFFLTYKAYFTRTTLMSSILMFSMLFSILIFTILTDSKWKISMITTIDEQSELDEMRFLINDYWRFQIINQFC